MADEGSFLRAILANPTDDLPRLVYADWLEEQQTEDANLKAEFLREQHALAGRIATAPKRNRKQRRLRLRLRFLAAQLPVGWLAAVSHVAVEGCDAGGTGINEWRLRRTLQTVEFAYECPKDWAAMSPTNDEKVRHCEACKQNVHFCETIAEARHHAWAGECVAINLALHRSRGDLERPRPRMATAGMIAPTYWDRVEEERGEGTG